MWQDKTGLKHPTLIVIDITDEWFREDGKILLQKPIESYAEFFKDGKIRKTKLPRIKGYKYINCQTNWSKYVLYVGYAKEQ